MEDREHSSTQTAGGRTDRGDHIPALTGIRFFAVFHIFLFHLFAWYWGPKPEGLENRLSGLANAPDAVVKLASNGWMSTSFFFLLSGFILAYLYWGEDGELTMTRRRFWLLRAARIYPIHLIVIALIIAVRAPLHLADGMSPAAMAASAVATITLVQAWVPQWIPPWSWPTWTLSVLVFLYLIMPWLMRTLSRLSHRQMILALAAMPIVSMIPTVFYALRMASGAQWNMSVDMIVANNPLVWVPHFAAGMLMTRVFGLSRFKPSRRSPSWFAWGDLAIVVIIVAATSVFIEQPWKFFIRQGLLMPLFMLIVLDFARGRGIFARLSSLPGTAFLGETAFSIFIWQSVLVLLLNVSLVVMPSIGPIQHWLAIGLILVLAIASTYLVEKPLARWIRRRLIDRAA